MDFYSITIDAPAPEEFYNTQTMVQLAQIDTWNNDVMGVFWIPSRRQIIINIDDEWIAQPDTANIVTSMATLFSCEDYQIRIKEVVVNTSAGTPEEVWMVYTGTWFEYANQNVILQFRADVDYDSEQAPRWEDIVPDSQPNAQMTHLIIE